MKIGFTGSREGMTEPQTQALYDLLAKFIDDDHETVTEFHHGDCRGADATAAELADDLGYWIVAHPPLLAAERAMYPSDDVKPPRPYLARNHAIVAACDLLLAAPSRPEYLRSGTWATIRYARALRQQRLLVSPDGTVGRDQ